MQKELKGLSICSDLGLTIKHPQNKHKKGCLGFTADLFKTQKCDLGYWEDGGWMEP